MTISVSFFFLFMHAKLLESYLALCDPMDCNLPGSSLSWDSPGKNTGVGCHALLQGIFPIFLLYHIQIKTWTERNRRFKVSFYFAIKKWLQVYISGINSVFLIKFKKYFPIAQLFSVPYIWSYISNCRFFIKVILSHILGIRNFCVFCLNEILKKITDL